VPKQTVEADTAKFGVAGSAKTLADCVTVPLKHVGALLVYVSAERAVTVFVPVAAPLANVTLLPLSLPSPFETHSNDPV
jgi:hypothetical protein